MLAPWIDGRCGYHSIYSQEQAFKDLVAAQPPQVFRGAILLLVAAVLLSPTSISDFFLPFAFFKTRLHK